MNKMNEDGFKDRATGTVLVRMYSNFEDEILEWKQNVYTKCIFRGFHFKGLRSGQFSTRLIISLCGNDSSAHSF